MFLLPFVVLFQLILQGWIGEGMEKLEVGSSLPWAALILNFWEIYAKYNFPFYHFLEKEQREEKREGGLAGMRILYEHV